MITIGCILGWLVVGVAVGHGMLVRDMRTGGLGELPDDWAGIYLLGVLFWPIVVVVVTVVLPVSRGFSRLAHHAERNEQGRRRTLREREQAMSLREERIKELEREVGIEA